MAANNIYIQVDLNSQSAQQNVNALNQAIAQTGPTATKSSQQATAGLNSVSVSVQQTTRAFGELTTALAGLGIGRIVANMVQVGSELGRAQTMMTAFTGSAEEAAKVFEQIRVVAAQSTFKFKDLEEAGRALLGFGAAAKDVPATLKIVTDQVTAMGGSIENVNSIIRIFGRVMDKDFVGAMDLMRLLPQQGVKVMDALRDALGRAQGTGRATVAEVQKAMKEGVLDPAETMRVILEGMRKQTEGAGARVSDFAKDMKNLGDAFDATKGKLLAHEGFGEALDKLAGTITEMLAPIGELVDWLTKLDEPTKEMIVNFTAAATGAVALSAAFTLINSISGPLIAAIKGIGKALLFAFANPEIALALATITAFVYTFQKLYPEEAKHLEEEGMKWIGGMIQKLKDKAQTMLRESGLIPKDTGTPAASTGTGDVSPQTAENLAKVQKQVDEWSTAASKTLLVALGAPADAVAVKYKELFQKLTEQMKDLSVKNPADVARLEVQLGTAEKLEADARVFQKQKQNIEEVAKLDEERVKGSYEAQIAYIEALDAKDLNGKVAAIDRVTDLRIASANKVAKVQDDALQQVFDDQKELFGELAAQGVDVTEAVADARKTMTQKQAVIDQKAVDDGQKYRLEGWKKANDAIIEDQKRVFDAFKSEFDQLFDAFTSKSPGKAIANVFRSLAIGEAKDLFSSTAASAATAAAGYGVPSPEITRGGILGQLMRRGMPPRPPGAPPDEYTPVRPHSEVNFGDVEGGANRFASSTNTYETATMRFALAVSKFSATASQGSANRSADDGGGATASEAAMLSEVRRRESSGNYAAQSTKSSASGAYQFTSGTWKMATQATGIGTQYGSAKDAPQAVQDANALWLLRQYGPNSTTSWAESGPYGTGGSGGADFSTTVYGVAPVGGGGTAPGYDGGFAPSGMSTDQMMALPTIARMGGLPALVGAGRGGTAFNPAALTGLGTKLLSNWKGMLGFGAVHGQTPGAESLARAGGAGSFSWSGLANSPLAKAGAGLGGGMLANYGLLGPAMGTGAGIVEGTLGGAGLGFSIGGPLGAGIGAAAGLGIGVGEMLAGVESPRRRVWNRRATRPSGWRTSFTTSPSIIRRRTR